MHIIIGLGIAVALLYFWLRGHWFARVLVFLGLMAGLGGFGGLLLWGVLEKSQHGTGTVGAILGCLIGGALAWPLAGLPTYYLNHRIGRMIVRY